VKMERFQRMSGLLLSIALVFSGGCHSTSLSTTSKLHTAPLREDGHRRLVATDPAAAEATTVKGGPAAARTSSRISETAIGSQSDVKLTSYGSADVSNPQTPLPEDPPDLPGTVEDGTAIANSIDVAAGAAADELSLMEVIQLASAANPDLQAATERTWIADATLNRARAEFYPTLAVSESYGVSNNPVNVFGFQLNQAQLSFNQDFNNPATTDNFDTRVRLQHGLYTGGRRTAERHAAAWQTKAAEAGMANARNQLMYRVAEAYFRLLQARELVGVRGDTVDQVQSHLEIVQSRFRAETAVESDVLTVDVRLAEAREALISSRHQVELAWAVLDNVAGCHVPRRPLPAHVPAAPWDEHLQDVEQAVASALSIRPEVRQVGSQFQSAKFGIESAKSGNRPTLSLVGDYDVFTGNFRDGNDSFFVGLVAQLNLLDFGRTDSDVAKACARAREIAALRRRAVADIELDVRRAFLQLSDSRERLDVSEKAAEQAQESLREIEVRYRGQSTTITRLIDAQVALSNARVRRANAEADVEIARASLERATGRLSTVIR
jgi:outer membrane protein